MQQGGDCIFKSSENKMAEGQEAQKKITITVKTPKEKQTIECDEDASIKDVSYNFIIKLIPFEIVFQVLLQ